MNRIGRATLMLSIGVVVARLLWTGGFGWFVQQRMRWPLLIATVVLVVFGLYEVISGSNEELHDEEAAKRSAGPAVGWMLALPLAVLISVAPTGLGAAAADRVDAFVPTENDDAFAPLDTSDGPPKMGVFEFVDRALWDPDESLAGQPVLIEGLVVNDPDNPGTFKLTRFLVSCCAADGIPVQVIVHGAQPLANDTWVEVELEWREPTVPYGENDNWDVEADAISVTTIADAPSDAYEELGRG